VSESRDFPSVRRPKVFHSEAFASIDFSAVDWDSMKTVTIEQVDAQMHRPTVRLRRLLKAPRWAAQKHADRTRVVLQRASRGWTDGDLWNLDRYLCHNLGTMLAIHADQARNHPPELAHDDWMRQIRTASEDLLAYDPHDAERVAAARAALHWAADNLVDLWD
jgi:hypothetical protein